MHFAIRLIGLLRIISLVGIYTIIKKMSFSKTLTLIILFVSLAVFGFITKVGNLGGQICHT